MPRAACEALPHLDSAGSTSADSQGCWGEGGIGGGGLGLF